MDVKKLLVLPLCAWLTWITPAAASIYDPVAVVNGEVITQYDVAQRQRLRRAFGAEAVTLEAVVDELTKDRLRVQEAAALGLQLNGAQINSGLEEYAQSRGFDGDTLLDYARQEGVSEQALRDFIETQLVWREILTSRFRDRSIPTEEDVTRAMSRIRAQPVTVYEIAEIALPYAERGPEETRRFARALAEDLSLGASFEAAVAQYSRSNTARDGGRMPPVAADNLSPEIRTALSGLDPDDISAPIPIDGGIVILRLISKYQAVPPRDPNETEEDRREAVRALLFSEKIEKYGEDYLQELMADALIDRP